MKFVQVDLYTEFERKFSRAELLKYILEKHKKVHPFFPLMTT